MAEQAGAGGEGGREGGVKEAGVEGVGLVGVVVGTEEVFVFGGGGEGGAGGGVGGGGGGGVVVGVDGVHVDGACGGRWMVMVSGFFFFPCFCF